MTREKIIKSASKMYSDVIVDRAMLTSLVLILGEVGKVDISSGNYKCESLEDIFSAPSGERMPIVLNAKSQEESPSVENDYFSVNISSEGVHLYCNKDTPNNEERFNRLRKVVKDGFWKEKNALYPLDHNWVFKVYGGMALFGFAGMLFAFFSMILGYRGYWVTTGEFIAVMATISMGGSMSMGAREIIIQNKIRSLPKLVLILDSNDALPPIKANIPGYVTLTVTFIFGSAATFLLDKIWDFISTVLQRQ